MSANGRSCTGGHRESHLSVYSALRLLSSESLHTHRVKKKRKKKTPVSTRNRKQWYEKENKNLWTHKATKEAGIFLFTVSIFYTHIYLYKGFMPFPVCPYEWQAECWCCCFLSALLLFNAELALYWQGRLLKNIPQKKAPHCQIRAWHRNVRANTSRGTNTTFTFCTDTSRLPFQSCTIIHCKKKWGLHVQSWGCCLDRSLFGNVLSLSCNLSPCCSNRPLLLLDKSTPMTRVEK